jgi:hypothetical protein
MVEFTNRVSVPAHVMVRVLDNEAIFLNLKTERYMGLKSDGHSPMATAHHNADDRHRVSAASRGIRRYSGIVAIESYQIAGAA